MCRCLRKKAGVSDVVARDIIGHETRSVTVQVGDVGQTSGLPVVRASGPDPHRVGDTEPEAP